MQKSPHYPNFFPLLDFLTFSAAFFRFCLFFYLNFSNILLLYIFKLIISLLTLFISQYLLFSCFYFIFHIYLNLFRIQIDNFNQLQNPIFLHIPLRRSYKPVAPFWALRDVFIVFFVQCALRRFYEFIVF